MQKSLENSNFVVFLLKNYENNIINIMKFLKEKKYRTCHILLRTPYEYFVSDLKENHMFSNDFYFVDVLSSHYKIPEKNHQCVFLDYPHINTILEATKNHIETNKCNVVLFDSISSLLKYHRRFEIQKLTNELKNLTLKKSKIVFLMPKQEELSILESENLLKDLKLYADTIKELF